MSHLTPNPRTDSIFDPATILDTLRAGIDPNRPDGRSPNLFGISSHERAEFHLFHMNAMLDEVTQAAAAKALPKDTIAHIANPVTFAASIMPATGELLPGVVFSDEIMEQELAAAAEWDIDLVSRFRAVRDLGAIVMFEFVKAEGESRFRFRPVVPAGETFPIIGSAIPALIEGEDFDTAMTQAFPDLGSPAATAQREAFNIARERMEPGTALPPASSPIPEHGYAPARFACERPAAELVDDEFVFQPLTLVTMGIGGTTSLDSWAKLTDAQRAIIADPHTEHFALAPHGEDDDGADVMVTVRIPPLLEKRQQVMDTYGADRFREVWARAENARLVGRLQGTIIGSSHPHLTPPQGEMVSTIDTDWIPLSRPMLSALRRNAYSLSRTLTSISPDQAATWATAATFFSPET